MLNKIPKRLRLVNIWASTRFFQRAFMVALVMWMCFILYTAKFVQQVLQTDEIAKFHQKLQVPVGEGIQCKLVGFPIYVIWHLCLILFFSRVTSIKISVVATS